MVRKRRSKIRYLIDVMPLTVMASGMAGSAVQNATPNRVLTMRSIGRKTIVTCGVHLPNKIAVRSKNGGSDVLGPRRWGCRVPG